MKKLTLTFAVMLGLFVSASSPADAGQIPWKGKRVSSLDGQSIAGHAMALTPGLQYVGVVTGSKQDMAVKVFRLEKDFTGEVKLVPVQVKQVSRDGVTLLQFNVERPAPYVVLIANRKAASDRYAVVTTGEFFGQPFMKKIRA